MGMFSRKEMILAAKVSARARYVDAHVQRVDITIKDVDGDSTVVKFTLDQVRQLITDERLQRVSSRAPQPEGSERIATRRGMR